MTFPTIIVADNEPSHRVLLSEILMDEGYPHIAIVSLEGVWPLVTQVPPGLVLLDMGSRPHVAWDVLEQIRGYPPTVALPVILCTTNPLTFTEHERALQRRGCFILAKPFEVSRLLALTVELLGPPPDERERGAPYAAPDGAVLP